MARKMKAAVLRAVNEPLTIEDVEIRSPGEGEVMIEIKAAGLCHTDLHFMNGSMAGDLPMILGHEGAGVVVECGPGVTMFEPGDHAVPFVVPECGQCPGCASTQTNVCFEMFAGQGSQDSPVIIDGQHRPILYGIGSFGEYAVVKETQLVNVRKDAPFDILAYIGCGVATGVGAAMFTAKVTEGSSVAVFGLGGVGLNVVQGARLAGAKTIIGIDTNPAKEAMARKFGATDFFNPLDLEEGSVAKIMAYTGGGVDFSFECVGNTKLMTQAFQSLALGWGLCTIVGGAGDGDTMQIPPNELIVGRSLKGSLMGGVKPHSDLNKLVDWYMDGTIDVDSLVTHRLGFDQINEGYDLMRDKDPNALRAVVSW